MRARATYRSVCSCISPDQAAARVLLGAGLLLSLVACGAVGETAKFPGTFEQPPLLHRVDARVLVYCPPPVRNYVYVTPFARFPAGQPSAARLRQSLRAMFSEVDDAQDWPPWRAQPVDADGVIELEEIDMRMTVGPEGRQRRVEDINAATTAALLGDPSIEYPDLVKVSYRLCLYRADGALISCATGESENSHTRTGMECLPDTGECLAQQADTAMRDAMAVLLLTFERDPKIKAWADAVTAARRGQ